LNSQSSSALNDIHKFMPVSPRIIKGRIKSVKNTRKITKAMELVAASKMRKSVQLTLASRAYSGTAKKLVDEIRKYVNPSTHAFLSGAGEGLRRTPEHQNTRTLLVVAASDRGLCGGFNAQVLKKAHEFLRNRGETDIRIITVGRRAESSVRRAGYNVLASFPAISNAPSFEGAMPVGRLAVKEFSSGAVNRIFVAYTDFKSAILQEPVIEQLLPITPEEELGRRTWDVGRGTDLDNDPTTHDPRPTTSDSSILFEPSPGYVLDNLLPRLIETRVYQALLESSASEHSSRMMAMRNATDNASSMIEDLTFTFNQARQAGITREISEISAGKAALE
jgi:F-type H+-transporting ATPase subunit gamma